MWMFFLWFKRFFCFNSSPVIESTRWIHSRLSRRVRSATATFWVLFFFSPASTNHAAFYSIITAHEKERERGEKNVTFHVFAHVSYPGCENSRGYNETCGWSWICPSDVFGFLKLFWVSRSCVWHWQKFTLCIKQSACHCCNSGVLVLH